MIDEGLFLPLYFHKRKKNNYGAQLVVPKSRTVVGLEENKTTITKRFLLFSSIIESNLISKQKRADESEK